MATLIWAKDWSQTPLGPIETWSLSLRMMVSVLLANRFPLLLWWGENYISIYNDAYRPVLGAKHPWALGQPGHRCWAEIWHILRPLIDAPFHGGPATWMDDIALEINRHGFVEETHFTIAYSPVPDDTAPRRIGGVLATVHEITDKIVGERRIAALRDLGAHTGDARSAEEACAIAARALATHTRDIPFALVYLIDEGCGCARLAGASGVSGGAHAAPETIMLDAPASRNRDWPLTDALRSGTPLVVDDLSARFAAVPQGPWSDPPHTAVVVSIKSNIAHQPAGFLVAGASPRLRLDEPYRGFFDIAAAQIGNAIAHARAYEEERRRAAALAEIDRVKTRFFSNVSHEFRTPLTLMLGPLEDALAGTGLPLVERERLAVARRNSLRLLKLVNSLLDFSRIEAGREQAVYRPVDLAALTAELASNFRSACERAGLRLVVDCPTLPRLVHVDRDMWEKIVLNLLSNAFKFTFEGEIAVRLRAGRDTAELTVEDTGVGIPAAELPRLFDRFHRIEGQKSRTHEGSGIGLALVLELVRLHGGTIRADSDVNRGTRFTVSIPFGIAHLPKDRVEADQGLSSTSVRADAYVQEALRWLPDEDAPAPTATDAEAADTLAGARILVADDNADMRGYVRGLLGGACELRAVPDGEAALQALQAWRPDLVLTDVMMPRLDGFELLRAIRADPALRDIPVIMVSARAGEESRLEGLKVGADDYLVKPFSARELIARVGATLHLARVRREAAAALRESEARLRAFVTASSDVVYRMNPDWSEMRCLDGRGFIADTREPDSAWMDRYIHPADRHRVVEAIGDAIRRKGPFEFEHRVLRRDGSIGWMASRAVPLLDADGGIVEWFGAASDVTERRRHEERQRLLVNELNHRVKNTLVMVQSMAMQTLRNSRDTDQAREQFEARLMALSRAHDILTRESWEGAPLRNIVAEAVAPYLAEGRDRFDTGGPDLSVSPKCALTLAMVLHELCTNAVKYGALSNDAGRVRIAWTVTRPDGAAHLRFSWSEEGGPPVRPPERRGFGSRLIEQGLNQDLGGEVRIEFAPGGVVCVIEVPLEPQPGTASGAGAAACGGERDDLGFGRTGPTA